MTKKNTYNSQEVEEHNFEKKLLQKANTFQIPLASVSHRN